MCVCLWYLHTKLTSPIDIIFGMKTQKPFSCDVGYVRLTTEVIWGHQRSNKNLFLTIRNNFLYWNFLCLIDLVVRVFTNTLVDQGSIPGRVIPKTQKMVHDATLLNTQYYKVRIKGKVEQSRERSTTLP